MTIAKNICLSLLIGSFCWMSACRQTTEYQDYTSQKVAKSDEGMVVAAHPLAAKVGVDMLAQGGNAIDAVVAVQFALAVVYPRAGNLGGGGFMLYDEQDGETVALDFREKAPLAATKDMYLDTEGNPVDGLSTRGALAVGVPGSVDGLLAALEKYGALKDRALVLKGAIDLARKGFAISATEAERLNKYAEDFKEQNAYLFPFVKNSAWKVGDVIVQKKLAQTLQAISDKGRAGFYEGTVAGALLNTMQMNSGIITQADLNNYESKWKAPIQYKYKGYEVNGMPLPSSGGIVMMQMLKMLAPFNLDSLGFQTAESIHLLSEVERSAYEVRAKYMGDPDHYPVPIREMLSDTFIDSMRQSLDLKRARVSITENTKQANTPESFETTHTSIIDQAGNSVSLTTTLNANYGSKLYVKGAGFFLNNEMDDFSVKPGVANLYGLVGAEANAIAAEKRMLSSMSPTIIKKDDQAYMVLGAPGGSTIITAVMQVFLNMSEYDMSLEESVNSCRTHHQWLPDHIFVEKGCLSIGIRNALKAKGHQLKDKNYMAKIKAIYRGKDGSLTGVGDKRNPDDHAQGL